MSPPDRSTREPVVITGVGAVSPVGCDFAEIAENLLAGRSGVRAIDPGPHAREPVQFAGPVTVIPPPPVDVCGLESAEFERLARLERLCLSPAASALVDSGIPRVGGPRIGLVLGIGAEHLKTWELDFLDGGTAVFEGGRDRTLVHRLARRLGLRGAAVTVAAACASSGYAMAMGRTWIDSGWVDACLVGGCDILSPTSIAAACPVAAERRPAQGVATVRRRPRRLRDGGGRRLLRARAAGRRRRPRRTDSR